MHSMLRGHTSHRWFHTTFLFAAALAIAPTFSPLRAQTEPFWEYPTTAGFMGLGCWAGYLGGTEAKNQADYSSGSASLVLVSVIGGCVSAAYLGRKVGREVDRLLAAGEELPTGYRRGAQLGTVLTGAFVASLFALIPASSRKGQKTETVLLFSAGGAVAGGIVQALLNHRLDPDEAEPSIQLGIMATGNGSAGVVVRLR